MGEEKAKLYGTIFQLNVWVRTPNMLKIKFQYNIQGGAGNVFISLRLGCKTTGCLTTVFWTHFRGLGLYTITPVYFFLRNPVHEQVKTEAYSCPNTVNFILIGNVLRPHFCCFHLTEDTVRPEINLVSSRRRIS